MQDALQEPQQSGRLAAGAIRSIVACPPWLVQRHKACRPQACCSAAHGRVCLWAGSSGGWDAVLAGGSMRWPRPSRWRSPSGLGPAPPLACPSAQTSSGAPRIAWGDGGHDGNSRGACNARGRACRQPPAAAALVALAPPPAPPATALARPFLGWFLLWPGEGLHNLSGLIAGLPAAARPACAARRPPASVPSVGAPGASPAQDHGAGSRPYHHR